jgi:hypothetical protein
MIGGGIKGGCTPYPSYVTGSGVQGPGSTKAGEIDRVLDREYRVLDRERERGERERERDKWPQRRKAGERRACGFKDDESLKGEDERDKWRPRGGGGVEGVRGRLVSKSDTKLGEREPPISVNSRSKVRATIYITGSQGSLLCEHRRLVSDHGVSFIF